MRQISHGGRRARWAGSLLLLAFAAACSDQAQITSVELDDAPSFARVDAVDLGPQSSHGDGILVNGSFETGDFTGWTFANATDPFWSWAVTGAGNGGTFLVPGTETQPQDGASVAWHGFDGAGPTNFDLWQDVDLPAACGLELSWQDRIQWFVATPFATLPKDAFVEIRDLDDNVLRELSHTEVPIPSLPLPGAPPTNFDTGWLDHTADITSFAGSTVRIAFRQYVPEDKTGPGQFEVDHVAIVATGGGGGGSASAALVPVPGKSLKKDKGEFTVEFSCDGGCGGPAGTPSATLNGIPVENGQVVKLELKSKKSKKNQKSKKNKLKIKDTAFELVVECPDGTVQTATPVFADKSKKSKKGKKP